MHRLYADKPMHAWQVQHWAVLPERAEALAGAAQEQSGHDHDLQLAREQVSAHAQAAIAQALLSSLAAASRRD